MYFLDRNLQIINVEYHKLALKRSSCLSFPPLAIKEGIPRSEHTLVYIPCFVLYSCKLSTATAGEFTLLPDHEPRVSQAAAPHRYFVQLQSIVFTSYPVKWQF